MTRKEKQRKIKLIMLIMIVEREKFRRKPNKSIEDILALYIELGYWSIQLQIISAIPTFKKGGVMESK